MASNHSLNPLALATKGTTPTPTITVTSGGGTSSSPVLSPGSYGEVTAGSTLIAMPAATTSSKYVVRSGGRWYSVPAALSAAGAALTVEPSLGDAIRLTTTNPTVTAGHGITGVAGTQYDIYAVYETPILSSGTPTIELKTTTKNSIINVSNLNLNSTNAALEYKITSTNNPDSTVQILLYTGGDSVNTSPSLPTIPNYRNTAAITPAALTTNFTKFGNDWWAFKIDMTYSQSGIAQYPSLSAQPGDDYSTLSNLNLVGGRLVLHITRGLILQEGSHGKADINTGTGDGVVTGLTAIIASTNTDRERHGYVVKNITTTARSLSRFSIGLCTFPRNGEVCCRSTGGKGL
ncbi:hypothetical protein AGMMS50267_17660 [Spirochaetia bacterium]|nr:hypothetical protein AGMMS50267_17660 [Spirochaetia bacterium]